MASSPSVLVRKGEHQSAWNWLAMTMLFSQLMPEYIAPFFAIVGFLVMKRSFKKVGQKVKMGNFGKSLMIFMVYYLATFLYSGTKLYSILIALLWMGMFLGQLMITNLVDTKGRLDRVLLLFVQSASLSAAVGMLQFFTMFLKKYDLLPGILPNPISAPLDNAVFSFLQNTLGLQMVSTNFQTRACGTFNNPNLYAAFLVCVVPIAFYFFLNGKTIGDRITYGFLTLVISGGIAASQSRGAMVALVISLVFMVLTDRKYLKRGLAILSAAVVAVSPIFLGRVRELKKENLSDFKTSPFFGKPIVLQIDISIATHLHIYMSMIEYILTHPFVFFFGLGAGINNVWEVLEGIYEINQPHAHNILIELWAESGLIGIVLLTVSALILARNLVRVIRDSKEGRRYAFMIFASLLAFFIMGMTDFTISSPKILQVMFILLGFSQATYRIFLGQWKKSPPQT